ncbi:two component transcriptional regulator, winged helix family [Desulfobotulus alkaliphilus]|uniref:Two component transcriptional regulator, winged helix family n=1 Tax=Desulfobotulus alkaliphilus TaxID=622671 RepID=A0A562S6S6_9BACT|nr:response regulator transcription factor [Desulfobotulus alkaliphilus]TWI76823.1 two component transcriptional regulator, winged helix family [Desulfobotulus alkaliphilus]
MLHVLVIDDDRELTALLAEFMEPEGFSVEGVQDGAEGLEKALGGKADLVVLDVMMPGMGGLEVLRRLRAKSLMPVIMLTARGEEVDRIIGLEIGADDYLGKPFNPRELVARIRAVLRRSDRESEGAGIVEESRPLELGDVRLYPGSRRVVRGGEPVSLTMVEFDFLTLFLTHAGETMEREQLSAEVLGRPLGAYDRSVDVHVSSLRRKLGPRSDGVERIRAIRGVGYLYTE